MEPDHQAHTGSRGAAGRVRRSHAQTRATLRLAIAFLAAAALALAVGEPRWLPLHLFFAGAVVLAFSGVSLMLTVTWSAAPAPSATWAAVQRTLVAVGAAGVALGHATELVPRWFLEVAGLLYVAGLVVLAVLLVATVRRGVNRRFDAAVAAYAVALLAGVAGVAVGVLMAVDGPSPSLRGAHMAANLLGLVGLAVAGTLPYFVGTVVRSRMSPLATPRHLVAVLCWQTGALSVVVAALVVDVRPLATVGLAGYGAGIVAVLVSLPHPTRRQLRWAGPRMVALWLGGAWWVVAVSMAIVDTAAARPVFSDVAVGVLAVAGYGQILWGSLAYLLPMLRGGGPERLSEGFAMTRSWLGLVAVNLAGVAMVASVDRLAALAVAVWVADAGWRAVRVGTTRSHRPAGA